MNIPQHVIDAARIVERWAAENDVKSWRVGTLASRSELEIAAARYSAARQIGAVVTVEVWRGIGKRLVTGEAYDRMIDRHIAYNASRLTVGEVINVASDINSKG